MSTLDEVQLTLPEIERRRKISESKRGEKNPNYGKNRSEETRHKISEALRGEKNWNYGRKGEKSSRYGKKHSEETKRKMSEAKRGKNHPFYGKKLSKEHRHKISESKRRENLSEETRRAMSKAQRSRKHSEETRHKISEAGRGRHFSEEHRRKLSEANRGEKNHLWKGGISFDPYCPLFNHRRKESTRNKYARVCVKCGKSALQNRQRLCVDHVDENKEQGCRGHKWQLIPLCKSCHGKMGNIRRHLMLSLLLLKNKRAEINMEVITR